MNGLLEKNQEGTCQGESFSPGEAEWVKTKPPHAPKEITVISLLLDTFYDSDAQSNDVRRYLQPDKGFSHLGLPGFMRLLIPRITWSLKSTPRKDARCKLRAS